MDQGRRRHCLGARCRTSQIMRCNHLRRAPPIGRETHDPLIEVPTLLLNLDEAGHQALLYSPMRIIGLAGWSGSGKTTLLTKVIPRIVARGKRVSTLKHAHHGFDLDQPGKDSHAHRAAGASQGLIASAKRWASMHELRDAPDPP